MLFIFPFAESLNAQSPSSFKYQGVVRNADGEIMKNAEIALKISIFLEGSFTAYSEEYIDLKTNKAGVFSVNIGSGDFIMGNATSVDEIDWSENNYSLLVEMDTDLEDGTIDYLTMGVSPILSVPYAMHAKTVENADDADADPSNELQSLSYDPTTKRIQLSDGDYVNINEFMDDFEDSDNQKLSIENTVLSITDGNEIELAHLQDGVEDADADPNNEIQTLNYANNVLSLVNKDGEVQNSVTLSTGPGGSIIWSQIEGIPTEFLDGDSTEDADADPDNEMQTLSLDFENVLKLLDANGEVYSQVQLPEANSPLGTWGALTGIPADIQDGDDVDDADANPLNEIQTLVYAGTTLQLVNADGTTESSVEISTGQDADADPLNEIQYLELDGNVLKLKDAAGAEQSSINLPSGPGGSNDWNALNNVPADLLDGDQVDDADADATNEIQFLEIDGSVLKLKDASGAEQSSINLPSGPGGSNDWNALNNVPADLLDGDQVEDADSDPGNEFNTDVQLNGNALVITDGGGMQTVDLTALINDADSDSENEKQSLSIDPLTSVITLTNADGTIQSTIQVPAGPGGTGDGDNDATNELQDWSTLPGIPTDILDGDQVEDADSDPGNELQTLSFDAVTSELSLSNGNTISIPTGGTDADADPLNEIQDISTNGTSGNISLTDGSTLSLNVEDADADQTNELQTLSFDAVTSELSLSNGNTISIPTGGTDADADPLNEIQDISTDGTSGNISLTDGSTLSLNVEDGDADGTNELQTLSFDVGTSELTLTNGNTVMIPTGGTDADADPLNEIQDIATDGTSGNISLTDGSTLSLNVEDADADANNEIQDISTNGNAGNISLSDGSTLSLNVEDADADQTNELQTLSFDAVSSELTLSNGNTVTIPTGGTDADADPFNELQDLNVNSTSLTITNGDNVLLNDINHWKEESGLIHYPSSSASSRITMYGNTIEGYSGGSNRRYIMDALGIDYYSVGSSNNQSRIRNNVMAVTDGTNEISFKATELLGEEGSHEAFKLNAEELRIQRPGTSTGTLLTVGASAVLKPGDLFVSTGGIIGLSYSSTLRSGSLFLNAGLSGSMEIDAESGEINKSDTGDSDMLISAYAKVSSSGSISEGTPNLSVSKESIGLYKLTLSNYKGGIIIATVTAETAFGGFLFTPILRSATVSTSTTDAIYVRIWDSAGALTDGNFYIQVTEK